MSLTEDPSINDEGQENRRSAAAAEESSLDGTGTAQSTPSPAMSTSLPRFYPHYWRKGQRHAVYNGNPEALGWALDVMGRAVTFIAAGAFLSTALITLAKQAAGCPTEPEPGSTSIPPCDKRVYGIRPSSLLTTYTIVVGIVSASLMPLMGAIVDYTRHR